MEKNKNDQMDQFTNRLQMLSKNYSLNNLNHKKSFPLYLHNMDKPRHFN